MDPIPYKWSKNLKYAVCSTHGDFPGLNCTHTYHVVMIDRPSNLQKAKINYTNIKYIDHTKCHI